jgi:hypothetical protein
MDAARTLALLSEHASKWWPPPPPWDIYWPTVGLLIFAAWAACIALSTLRDIKEQTKIAKNSADAAKKSADAALLSADAALLNAKAIVNAERAWIEGGLQYEHKGGTFDCALRITNQGRTAADLLEWEIGVESIAGDLRDFKPGTLSQRLKKSYHRFLPPDTPIVLAHFDMVQYFAEWNAILAGHKTGVFEVAIRYKDIISGDFRETYFACSYSTTDGDFKRLEWLNRYD